VSGTGSHAEEVARLAAILRSEEELYRELIGLLQREREMMVDLDADGLADVVRHKENLAVEGRLIERGRIEVAERLAARLGLPDAPPTLSAICDRLGEDDGGLRAAHGRLAAVVGAARELVEANRALGGDRLAFVQTTLGLLGHLVPDQGGASQAYDRSGSLPEPTTPGGHLVRRTA